MRERRNGAGVGVDYRGEPVIDPTKNVSALIGIEKDHAKEIRALENKFYDYAVAMILKEVTLRAEYAKDQRSDDRLTYSAIRQVDITNQNAAAAQIDTALKALAKATEDTRKTLADGMENTRKTLAESMAVRDARVDERIGQLERGASAGEGRSGVANPMMNELVGEMKAVTKALAQGSGKSEGISWVGAIIMGSVSALAGLIAIAAVLYAVLKP